MKKEFLHFLKIMWMVLYTMVDCSGWLPEHCYEVAKVFLAYAVASVF